MTYTFLFPDVGEGIHEGELISWHVKEGDSVKEDQVICEIETDKAVVEIPSPRTGRILKLYGHPGEKIKVGSTLCEIEESTPSPANKQKEHGSLIQTTTTQNPPPLPSPQPPARQTHATPSTRKLARDLGIDISKVAGTGPSGRIIPSDLQRTTTQKNKSFDTDTTTQNPPEQPKKTAPSITYEKWGQVLKIPFRSIRRTISENLSRSYHTAVHVTHHDEIDVTELVALREKEKQHAENKGYKLTYLAFVVKAVCGALKSHPYLNSTLDETAEVIALKKYYNIGIAVQTDKGLLVPVLKNADKMSILEIAKEIYSLAEKARNLEISPDDMKGGTFTITNIGGIGGIHFTPIINYPECAILGTGKVSDKPVVVKGQITIRKIMPISLSFDHRIIDGAKAAEFINTLKELLEDPSYLMVEAV